MISEKMISPAEETAQRFTFFWNGPFSQWHPSAFNIEGVIYNTAEQFMMAEKARLFQDTDALSRIMAAKHPRDQKALGRRVRNFGDALWRVEARTIVYRGNRAKFTTHRDLLALLLATEGTRLVEASPIDTLWGIGLAADDPTASDPAQWRGLNWLGDTLTRLREDLLQEQRSGGIRELTARRKRRRQS